MALAALQVTPRTRWGYRRRKRNTSWSRSHYNYFRDYDPQIGRYVESDPIGLKGGSYSTYTYTGSNPISFVDELGLNPGMAGSSNDCSWYSQRCALSGGKSFYYCRAAPLACKLTPPSPWSRCVRQCLQDFDRACGRNVDGTPNMQCVIDAHAHCWSYCPGNTCSNSTGTVQ